eukprot:2288079-Amphidinium_carterae.1
MSAEGPGIHKTYATKSKHTLSRLPSSPWVQPLPLLLLARREGYSETLGLILAQVCATNADTLEVASRVTCAVSSRFCTQHSICAQPGLHLLVLVVQLPERAPRTRSKMAPSTSQRSAKYEAD